MIQNLDQLFSRSAQKMQKSAIREILKLTQQPGIISFAGGLPSPESFPTADLKKIVCEILDEEGASALQYSTTEGDQKLRELLVEKYKKDGVDVNVDDLIITTASQQGLDLIGKIFINPGDKVICGLPSYLGGISAFNTYGADLLGVPFDEHGMIPSKIEEIIQDLAAQEIRPKFIYIIPDFQNPAGLTYPNSRRIEILEIAKKYDLLIIEDSPYREVRFEGEPQKMLYDLDDSGRVVTLGTFSKIFVPGFRLGWMMGPEEIIQKVVIAKQSADLCTSVFVQKIVAKYIEKGFFEANLKKIISSYHEKRDLMLDSFKKYMPGGVTWTEPEGGLFLFLYLPEGMDAAKLFYKAVEKKVAFVKGDVFYCNGKGKNTMRINFSYANKEENVEGVKRLAEVIKEAMITRS
jgi:2-aminoadipate transaminase